MMTAVSTTPQTRFKCIKCGNCCNYHGLLVNLTPRDVKVLAKYLHAEAKRLGENVSDVAGILKVVGFYQVEEQDDEATARMQERLVFLPLQTHRGMAYLALLKQPDGACIFLKDNKCRIYPARPRICQTFPFSYARQDRRLAVSIAAFATEACPGLGQGPFVEKVKLEEMGKKILGEIDDCVAFTRRWNARSDEDPDSWLPEVLVRAMFHPSPISTRKK
jgi:Fe-S-cluster containining protein